MALKVDYVARETVTNLRRNVLLSTASVLTVAVSLSMVGMAFLLRYGVSHATRQWEEGIEFEVFLVPEATPEQKAHIERELSESPDVEGVQFIPRDEQYRLFRVYFANRPEYLENVRAEDLPESYRVDPSIDDPGVIETMVQRYQQEPGVESVAYAGESVKKAHRTSRGLQLAMYVVATVLLLASALLIFNTIRMAIFARRREIEVMKLVGATNWFIRVPFMIEGLIQGLVGAAGSFAAIYFMRQPLSNWIADTFSEFEFFSVLQGEVLSTGLVMLALGSLIGAASAGVAVTRFLDV